MEPRNSTPQDAVVVSIGKEVNSSHARRMILTSIPSLCDSLSQMISQAFHVSPDYEKSVAMNCQYQRDLAIWSPIRRFTILLHNRHYIRRTFAYTVRAIQAAAWVTLALPEHCTIARLQDMRSRRYDAKQGIV